MIASPPQAPEDFGIAIPSMNPEYDEAEGPRDRGYWSYGKRPTGYGGYRGWVVQLPYQDNLRMQYMARHFTYLDSYGLFLITQADGDTKYLTNKDARGVPWNSFREPWRLLFQKDGAREFPIDQLITAHWHLVPPYREARFPQLEELKRAGKEIYDYQCPECYERPVLFSSLNRREAAVMLRTHLTSRVNEIHSYSPQDLKELGAELGIDLISARVAVPRMLVQNQTTDSLEADIAPALESADLTEALNLQYQCAECGWAPAMSNKHPAGALRFHQRRHKKKE